MYAIKVKFEAPVSILNFLKWCTEVHPWPPFCYRLVSEFHHYVLRRGGFNSSSKRCPSSPDFQGSRNHWDEQMLPGEVGARSADPKICDGTTYSHAIYHLYLVTWSKWRQHEWGDVLSVGGGKEYFYCFLSMFFFQMFFSMFIAVLFFLNLIFLSEAARNY